MTKCILVTQESYPYFEALLSSEAKRTLTTDESTFLIGAIAYNSAVGVALVSVQKTTVHILYIYVSELYRRMGIASDMLKFMCEYAYEGEKVLRCSFPAKDIQDPIYCLFRDSGVFALEEGLGFTCRSNISELGAISKMVSPKNVADFKVMGIYELPSTLLRQWYEVLREEEKMLIDPSNFGYDASMSLCTLDNEGHISSALLMEEDTIAFIWCKKGYEVNIAKLLFIEYELMKKRYGEDKEIRVVAVNEASIGLVEKLMPKREIVSRFYEAIWDLEL